MAAEVEVPATRSSFVWIESATPMPSPPPSGHSTTVLGLQVVVELSSYTSWRVVGYLGDVRVVASGYVIEVSPEALEAAKSAAIKAARRLHAAGVRPDKGYGP